VSEPRRTELSDNVADYLTGPVAGESARTQGGTTRDGHVAVFGASRDDASGPPEGSAAQQVQQQTADAQTNPAEPDTSTRS
jgi:hypothetical protein